MSPLQSSWSAASSIRSTSPSLSSLDGLGAQYRVLVACAKDSRTAPSMSAESIAFVFIPCRANSALYPDPKRLRKNASDASIESASEHALKDEASDTSCSESESD